MPRGGSIAGVNPPADSCVECGAEFPLNHELASLPRGARIAFDTARGRVWRICTRCGTWHLAGPDTSSVSLGELEQRFNAALKRRSGAGLAPAKVSRDLELVRLGHVQAIDETALERRRLSLGRQEVIAVAMVVVTVPALAVDFAWMGLPGALADSLRLVCFFFPVIQIGTAIQRHRLGIPVQRLVVSISAVLVAVFVAVHVITRNWHLLGVDIVIGGAWIGAAFFTQPLVILSVYPHAPKIPFHTNDQIKAVTLWWGPDSDDIALHDLPGGSSVSGTAARVFLHTLVRRHAFTRPSTRQQAFALVRAVGGLRGVLRALDGYRRDQDGRVVIADLPATYRVALDLALTEDMEGTGPDRALLARVSDAQGLADVAESLDDD